MWLLVLEVKQPCGDLVFLEIFGTVAAQRLIA
jgi:hypothetical protein